MNAAAQIVDIVLALTLCVGLVGVAAVLVLTRSSGFRGDAAARFNLWFALLIVLAVAAPAVGIATTLSSWAHPVVIAPSAPVMNITRIVAAKALSATPESRGDTPAVYVPPRPESSRFTFATLVAALWLAGALGLAFRLGIGLLRVRSIARTAHVVGMRTIQRGQVRVVEHPGIRVPLAIGYRSPAIVIPRTLLAQTSSDDLEHIILHELEHLNRFDDVTSLVQALCTCIVWFNPVVHAIGRRLAADREMACDEAVVRRIGARHGYASTLWNVAIGMADSLAPSLSPPLPPARTPLCG